MRADVHEDDVIGPSKFSYGTDQRGDCPVIRDGIPTWLTGAVTGDQLHNVTRVVLLQEITKVDHVVFGPRLWEQREPDVEQPSTTRRRIGCGLLLGGQ